MSLLLILALCLYFFLVFAVVVAVFSSLITASLGFCWCCRIFAVIVAQISLLEHQGHCVVLIVNIVMLLSPMLCCLCHPLVTVVKAIALLETLLFLCCPPCCVVAAAVLLQSSRWLHHFDCRGGEVVVAVVALFLSLSCYDH